MSGLLSFCSNEPIFLSNETLLNYTILLNQTDLFDYSTAFEVDETGRKQLTSDNLNADLIQLLNSHAPLASQEAFFRFHGFQRTIANPVASQYVLNEKSEDSAAFTIKTAPLPGNFTNRIQTEGSEITVEKQFFVQTDQFVELAPSENADWAIYRLSPYWITTTNDTGNIKCAIELDEITKQCPIWIESIQITIIKAYTQQIQSVQISFDQSIPSKDSVHIDFYNPSTEQWVSENLIDTTETSANPLMHLIVHDRLEISVHVNEEGYASPYQSDSKNAWYQSNVAVFLHTHGAQLRVDDEFSNPENITQNSPKKRFQLRNGTMMALFQSDAIPLYSNVWKIYNAEIISIGSLDSKRKRIRDYLYIETMDAFMLSNPSSGENDYFSFGVGIPIRVRYFVDYT